MKSIGWQRIADLILWSKKKVLFMGKTKNQLYVPQINIKRFGYDAEDSPVLGYRLKKSRKGLSCIIRIHKILHRNAFL